MAHYPARRVEGEDTLQHCSVPHLRPHGCLHACLPDSRAHSPTGKKHVASRRLVLTLHQPLCSETRPHLPMITKEGRTDDLHGPVHLSHAVPVTLGSCAQCKCTEYLFTKCWVFSLTLFNSYLNFQPTSFLKDFIFK